MPLITWGQRLGREKCPYLRRWVLDLGWFAVRLHRWLGSDDPRHLHDHPWWYLTLILWGGYRDVGENGEDKLGVGSVRCRPARWRHTVQVNPGGCWSLLLTGPERRVWGFWVHGKFRHRNKYFFEHGQHPCEAEVKP